MFFRHQCEDGTWVAESAEDLINFRQPEFHEEATNAWKEMEGTGEVEGLDREQWLANDISEQRAEFLRGLIELHPDATGRLVEK